MRLAVQKYNVLFSCQPSTENVPIRYLSLILLLLNYSFYVCCFVANELQHFLMNYKNIATGRTLIYYVLSVLICTLLSVHK